MAAMADSTMLRFPDNWLRALLAGIEAAVLTWLLAVTGGLVSYVATAAAPGLGQTSWGTAVDVSTRWWRLAFGGHAPLDDGVITLAPLGLTLVAVVLVRAAARRFGVVTPGAALVTVAAFTTACALLSLAATVRGGTVIVGALAAGALGGATALQGRMRLDPRARAALLRRVPDGVGAGLRGAGTTLGLAVLAGTALVLLAAATSWDAVREIHDSLHPEVASAIVLSLFQLAYLPVAALWALSWLAGPGFAVGTGTSWTTGAVTAAPLPAIPALGALPAPGPGPGAWALLLLVALGAVAGFWRTRRAVPSAWSGFGVELGTVLTSLFLVFTAWGLLASGSIGPGRMASTGVGAPLAGIAIAGWLTLGFGLAVLTRMPLARAAARAPLSSLRSRGATAHPAGPASATPVAAAGGPTAPTALSAPGAD